MPIQLAEPEEDWSSDYQPQVQPIAGKEPWKVQDPQTLTTFHHDKYWHDDRILVPDTRIEEIISSCNDAITPGHWVVGRPSRFSNADTYSTTERQLSIDTSRHATLASE